MKVMTWLTFWPKLPNSEEHDHDKCDYGYTNPDHDALLWVIKRTSWNCQSHYIFKMFIFKCPPTNVCTKMTDYVTLITTGKWDIHYRIIRLTFSSLCTNLYYSVWIKIAYPIKLKLS